MERGLKRNAPSLIDKGAFLILKLSKPLSAW